MRSLELNLHSGGELVCRQAVHEVVTPPATASWTPVPHGRLINNVSDSLTRAGLEIVHEQFALAKDGARMFGLLQVARPGEDAGDYSLVMGVRNSHDRSFSAGFCVGAGVFVCSNLSFRSEINIARKHTRHVLRALPELVDLGIGRLIEHRNKQDLRFGSYKQLELTDHHASDLIIRAFEQRVVGPLRIQAVIDQWRNSNHPEFAERNGWRLFNAFTEALKGSTLAELPRRTQALHGLLDKECGLALSV